MKELQEHTFYSAQFGHRKFVLLDDVEPIRTKLSKAKGLLKLIHNGVPNPRHYSEIEQFLKGD